MTYGTPTWIWAITVDGDLYVRAYNGTRSRWYQAAMRQTRGRITAAGITRDVAFEPIVGDVNDRVDEAYRGEGPVQPVPQPDDRRSGTCRHGQDRACLRHSVTRVRQFCLPMRSSWTG